MTILIGTGLRETAFQFSQPFSLQPAVSATAPVNTGAPTITYVALTPGSTLTAVIGSWDWKGQAQGVPAFDIVWIEDGIDTAATAGTFSATLDGKAYGFKVRARNALGELSPWYTSATVAVAADTIAPTLNTPALDPVTGAIDLTAVSEPGTLFALIDQSPTPISGASIEAAVVAMTPQAYVSFAVATGANAGAIDKSGVTPGTAYFHVTIKDPSGNYSTDAPVPFTQPAASTNPAVRSSASALQSNGPNITVPFPAGVVAGDLLVVSITGYIAHTITVPAGWTLHASTPISQPTGLNRKMWVLTRVADGTEGANQLFAWTGGWAAASAVISAIQNYTALGAALAGTGGPNATVTHTGISVSANSLLLVAYAADEILTEVTAGDMLQSVVQGTSGNSQLARAGLAAGTSPTLNATAVSTYWAYLALEVQ